jgi:hypothetical protein
MAHGLLLCARQSGGFGIRGTEMSTPRRFFLYLLSIISLGVLAGGLAQLLTLVFDLIVGTNADIGGRSFSLSQFSMGLAMTVIAGPLWLLFWNSIQKRSAGDIQEIGAVLRKLYLNLIQTVTAIIFFTSASISLTQLFLYGPGYQFPSDSLAAMIISGVVWYFHWRVSEKEGHPSASSRTLRRWYIYILSAFGLIWLSSGIVQFINGGVIALPVWPGTIAGSGFWTTSTQESLAHIIFGGLAWGFHWFRMAKDDAGSTLRQVYFYLLTITGGSVAALVGITITLQRLLTFALSGGMVPDGRYFQFLGWTIPMILVGSAVWFYHQRVAKEESGADPQRRSSAERIHLYILSFIGLGTMSAGLILLFGIILNLISGISGRIIIIGTNWWQSQAGLSLALLIVGAVVWIYYWNRVLKRIASDSGGEVRALSRRIFLYGVIVIAIGTLIADFVNIVYQVLNGILQGNTSVIFRESRWSIQTLLVAAPVLWYHWQVNRADQKRGAEAAAAKKIVTLVMNRASAELIENSLGYHVRKLFTESGVVVNETDLSRVTAEIQSTESKRLLVTEAGGQFYVMPYQEK